MFYYGVKQKARRLANIGGFMELKLLIKNAAAIVTCDVTCPPSLYQTQC